MLKDQKIIDKYGKKPSQPSSPAILSSPSKITEQPSSLGVVEEVQTEHKKIDLGLKERAQDGLLDEM